MKGPKKYQVLKINMPPPPPTDNSLVDLLSNTTCESKASIAAYLKDLQRANPVQFNALKSAQPADATQTLELKGQIKKMSGDHFAALVYFSLALILVCGGLDGRPTSPGSEETYARLKERARSARADLLAQIRHEATQTDVKDALPAALSASDFKLSFNNLAGMHNEKMRMQEKFILPFQYPQLYMHTRNNVLLFGPPGNGKTNIAKAAVTELTTDTLEMSFFSYTASELRSKWEGGTEANIKAAFEQAEKHAADLEQSTKKTHMSFLFLDEIEALAADRGSDPQAARSVTTLLQQMDGMKELPHVVVMAATNYPWQLDGAFRRRFTAFVFVDLPDLDGRFWKIMMAYFTQIATKLPDHLSTVSLESVKPSDSTSARSSKHIDNNRALSGNEALFNALWLEFSDKHITDHAKILSPRMSSVVGPDATKAGPFAAESEDMFKSRVQIYTDNINRICGHPVFTDETFYQHTRTKLKDYLTNLNLNDDDNMFNFIDTADGINDIIKFCVFLALITGPNDFAYQTGYVRNRVTFPYTLSDFGHSFSDLEKIMAEYFTIIANRVIGACHKRKTEARERKKQQKLKQQAVPAESCGTSDQRIITSRNDVTSANLTYIGVDDKEHDMKTVFSVHHMRIALTRYDPTVGLEYCNLVVYNQSPDTGAPGARDKCNLSIDVLRGMQPKPSSAEQLLLGTDHYDDTTRDQINKQFTKRTKLAQPKRSKGG